MPSVKVRDTESFESALKHFKKQCEREGILSEIKKREHYDKPSVKKKKKDHSCPQKSCKEKNILGKACEVEMSDSIIEKLDTELKEP